MKIGEGSTLGFRFSVTRDIPLCSSSTYSVGIAGISVRAKGIGTILEVLVDSSIQNQLPNRSN